MPPAVADVSRYKHVYIDSVHYCEREVELAEKRKRKSFLNRNAEPLDPPKVRLIQLMRTVREDPHLALIVQTLRVPYMTREACKAELARTVAVLINLRYVDLPEGFFHDDPTSSVLKRELEASCPEIRRMKYAVGSEKSFLSLSQNQIWQNMEILELSGTNVDMQDLIVVLNSFKSLQELKLVDLTWLNDSVFEAPEGDPRFPPIHRLAFSGTPNITAQGLAEYLSFPQNAKVLTELYLATTGVQPDQLHLVLAKSPYLEQLTISEHIDHTFPSDRSIPPLSSLSLISLHYEVTSHSSPRLNLRSPTASYSTYLASSLLSNSLPALTELYVRDPSFPELLLLPLEKRVPHENTSSSFPNSATPSFAPPRGLNQPLLVYTKGLDELEWNFTSMSPPSPSISSPRSAARPISLMGTDILGPTWGKEARKSAMVGNGLGGFLTVPIEEVPGRPVSISTGSNAGGEWAAVTGQVSVDRTRKERKDLWR